MIMAEEESLIISALSTLSSSQLSDLTFSILSVTNHHHRRLSTILSSPTLFSITLRHLQSLSLHHKTLLISRHLLSSLRRLTHHFYPTITRPPVNSFSAAKRRDLDAVLLLLLLTEFRRRDSQSKTLESPQTEWRVILTRYWIELTLTVSGIGVFNGVSLIPFIEMVARCWRFVGGGSGKVGREVAASPAAVVALPSVVVEKGGGIQCVICREEMSEGRDVCELPCQHLFHWICILPWVRKRNTCPCCRFQLPTDDVFGEIGRLWGLLIMMNCKRFDE